MKRVLITLYIITLALCTTAYAQSPLDSLQTVQQGLNHKQDSLQRALSVIRGQFGSADNAARDSISVVIVELESSLFSTRSELGRVGSEISVAQEKIAQEQINQNTTVKPENITELHQSPKFVESLSKKDISMLANANAMEKEVEEAVAKVKPLYEQLTEVKSKYDRTMSQDEMEALLLEGQKLRQEIKQLDKEAGTKWQEYYNHVLGLYLVMLDMSPGSDRTLLEAIDNKGREVRRAETFIQQEALSPQLAAFGLQRELLHSYQKAIAQAEKLEKVYATLDAKDLATVEAHFVDVEFKPRVLTLYAPVQRNFEHPFTEVDSIPEIILPTRGVYYTVRIAIMSTPAKSLAALGSVGPLQLFMTKDGKYSYQVGGFKTYAQAQEGLKVVRDARYRAPAIIAYLNGELSTIKKAQEAEEMLGEQSEGGFKVVVKTQNGAAGELIKNSVDMHAKGTTVLRMVDGTDITFSIQTFTLKEDADVFAQILKDSINEQNITVTQIPVEEGAED